MVNTTESLEHIVQHLNDKIMEYGRLMKETRSSRDYKLFKDIREKIREVPEELVKNDYLRRNEAGLYSLTDKAYENPREFLESYSRIIKRIVRRMEKMIEEIAGPIDEDSS